MPLLIAAVMCVGSGRPAHTREQEALVKQARLIVETFADVPETAAMRTLLKDAKDVLVIPQLFRAGFFIVGSDGSGVLLSRNGAWSTSACYSMATSSIGCKSADSSPRSCWY